MPTHESIDVYCMLFCFVDAYVAQFGLFFHTDSEQQLYKKIDFLSN